MRRDRKTCWWFLRRCLNRAGSCRFLWALGSPRRNLDDLVCVQLLLPDKNRNGVIIQALQFGARVKNIPQVLFANRMFPVKWKYREVRHNRCLSVAGVN